MDSEMQPSTAPQEPLGDEQDPSVEIGANPAKARSLANLRPAWAPGQSGNPSGLTKLGAPTKTAPLRKELTRQMLRKRTYQRMVERWIKDAIDEDVDGSTRAKAREQILQRLDPIQDDAGQGRMVLEGIRLELTPGGASLTMARGMAAPTESVVVNEVKESCDGGQPTLTSGGQEPGNLPAVVPLELVSGVPPSTPTPVFDTARGGLSNESS